MTTYTAGQADRMMAEGYDMVDVTCIGDAEPKFVVARMPDPFKFEYLTELQILMLNEFEYEDYVRRLKAHRLMMERF